MHLQIFSLCLTRLRRLLFVVFLTAGQHFLYNHLWRLQSRSQRPRSSWSESRITNFWKNPKKNLRFYDCSIKRIYYRQITTRNYATMSFCLKIALFLKVMSMPLFNQFYTFMLLNLSYLHTALLIVSTNEWMCVAMANERFSSGA